MHGALWRALWFCLALIYVGTYWLMSKSDVDTEGGLQKVSNLLLGLVWVQVAVVIFIAFEASGAK